MKEIKHPLALLRFVLGKITQAEFGRLVGVSGNHVKKIEANQRALTSDITFRIQSVFGIDEEFWKKDIPPEGSREWKVLVVLCWIGVNDWRARMNLLNEDAEKAFQQYFLPVLRSAVRDAVREKQAVPFLLKLEQWLVAEGGESGALATSRPYTVREGLIGNTMTPRVRFTLEGLDRWTKAFPFVISPVRNPLHEAPAYLKTATEGWDKDFPSLFRDSQTPAVTQVKAPKTPLPRKAAPRRGKS